MTDDVSATNSHHTSTAAAHAVPSTKRVSVGENNAVARNKSEIKRLAIKLKQIDREKELNEQMHKKELNALRESMRSFRITTGKTEQPPSKTKLSKSIVPDLESKAVKTERSGSINSFSFNYELIQKQADENNGMLYNAFPIKSLQDPIYQYNPIFLRIKDTPESSKPESINGDYLETDRAESKINNNHRHNVEEPKPRSGFKSYVNEEEDEEQNEAEARAEEFEKFKAKFAKDNQELEFEEEKLEELFNEFCNSKNRFKPTDQQRIEELKKRDRIFAKRYRQFSAAKQCGRAPLYENEKAQIRLAMPKSAIDKRIKEMCHLSDPKSVVRENPYVDEQQKLSGKVTDFVKSLNFN